MSEQGSDSIESGASGVASAPADQVTSEFVAGVERPSESTNGFAVTEPEPAFAENPEVLLGVAFAGGFIFGRLVKRLGR